MPMLAGDQDFGCWDKLPMRRLPTCIGFCLLDRVSQPPDPPAASDQATFAVRDTRLLRTNGKSSTFPCCRKPICTPVSSSGRSVPHFVTDRTVPSGGHIRYPAVESTALARDTPSTVELQRRGIRVQREVRPVHIGPSL